MTCDQCQDLLLSYAAGALDPAEQTVIYNTGDGLKTLDAVAGRQAPTMRVKPSLRAAREAGLLD